MSSRALSNTNFLNTHGTLFTADGLMEAIKNYILLHPNAQYELVIGSDSKTDSTSVWFVTSVVLRRVGNGGIYFYTRTKEEKIYTMRDRIWKETMLSVTLAQELRGRIREVLGEEIFWDNQITFKNIHLDVGTNGPTRELIDGVTGMVKGFGFEPVIKPYSYGAFVVADLHT